MNNTFSYNSNSGKVIWIDLIRPDQIHFFLPIIKGLSEHGYKVKISLLNDSRMISLADQFNFNYELLGKIYLQNTLFKGILKFFRAILLFIFIRKNRPALFLSDGSVSQYLLSKLFKVPIVMFGDDRTVKKWIYRSAKIMFLPNSISKISELEGYRKNIIRYPGFKENLFTHIFKPDISLKNRINLNSALINILIIPPLTDNKMTSNDFLEETISSLLKNDTVSIFLLPDRKGYNHNIKHEFKEQILSNRITIMKDAADSLSLLWNCDILLGDNPVYIRTAAAFDVPVYCFSKTNFCQSNQHLVKNGKLKFIDNPDEVSVKVKLEKRERSNYKRRFHSLALQTVLNNIDNYLSQQISGDKSNNGITYGKNDLLSNEQ